MSHTVTKPFETSRLICRPFNMNDCEDMLRNWIADEDIQSEHGEPVYTTLPQVEKLVGEYVEKYGNTDFYRWAIIEKNSGECIGQIAFCRVYPDCNTAEIEYCIGKKFWGRGYAGEALQCVIDCRASLKTPFEKKQLCTSSASSTSLGVRQHAFGRFPCSCHTYLFFL